MYYTRQDGASGLRPIGQAAAEVVADLSFRQSVQKIYPLGPRVMAELLAEIGATYGIRSGIESALVRYAALTPEALAITGGDHFPAAPIYQVWRATG